MRRSVLSGAAALLVAAACTDSPHVPTEPYLAPLASQARSSAGDRYIVVFRDGVGNPEALTDRLLRTNGGQLELRYSRVLSGFAAILPAQALDGIRSNPNVAYVESDAVASVVGTETNPPSWGLDRIDQHPLPLDDSYTWDSDGSGVTAWIIDTGVRFDHQEFGGRASSGWDFVDGDADASDCHGHGTHVAGTVGGATVGVAKNVQIKAVRVLDCSGSGWYSWVIAGVDFAASHQQGLSVANMSLGGPQSNALDDAVDNAVAAGVVFAVAAGNSNANACNSSPAAAPDALTVGATSSSDSRASFSNWGSCLDVFAPGVGIRSSTMNGTATYASWSGTSMASPHVAGVAALYRSAFPGASATDVAAAVTSGATPGVVSNPGSGSPNLLLYSRLGAGEPSPPPPAAPTDLSATAASSSAIDLSWVDASADEDGFEIQQAPHATGSWSTVATVGTDVTSFPASGLSASTEYDFRVRAYSGPGGPSGWSNTATETTLAPPAPDAPTNLSATAASSSAIDLSWVDNSDNEDGFAVEQSDDGGTTWSAVTTVGAGVTSYQRIGLAASTEYSFRVRAFNDGGPSDWSNTATETTLAPPADVPVHVGATSATENTRGRKWWGANLQVTVHDVNHDPVAGVTVEVAWSGAAGGGSATCTTGASGTCSVDSDWTKSSGTIQMTVTGLSGSGVLYDDGSDHAPTSRSVSR